MKVEKIVFKNEKRININIPTSWEINSLLRHLTKRTWGSTLHSWNLPYIKEAFRQFKRLFSDVGNEKVILEVQKIQAITSSKTDSNLKTFNLHNSNMWIILEVIKKESFLQLHRFMHYSRWGKNQSCWINPIII